MGDSSASGDAPDTSLISSSGSNHGGCHGTADSHSYASTLFSSSVQKPFGQGYVQHSRCPTSASTAYAPHSVGTGPGMHLPLYPSPPSFPPPSVQSASKRCGNNSVSGCSSNKRKTRRKPPPGILTDSDYSVTTTLSPTDPKRQKRRKNFKWPTLVFLMAIVSVAFLVFFYFFVFKTGIFSSSPSDSSDDDPTDYSDLYGSANGAPMYNPSAHDKRTLNKQRHNKSPKIARPLPPQIHVGQLLAFDLPPRRIAYTQFSVQHDSQFLFNLSVSPQAKIVLYTRQTLRPTPAQYDFQRLVLGDRLHLTEMGKSPRRRRRRHLQNTAISSPILKHALLNYFLLSGKWFFGFLSDDSAVQPVRLHISTTPIRSSPDSRSSPASVLEGGNDVATAVIDNSAARECQFNCFGKGMCQLGKCQCHPGYSGQFCEETACPVLCSGNGVFSGGKCVCHEGYGGAECELLANWCTNADCNHHGRCSSAGQCECDLGWTGEFCADAECVDPECSGHGICQKGQCFCVSGWWGERCEQLFDSSTMCTTMKGRRRHESSQSSEQPDQSSMGSTEILLPMDQHEDGIDDLDARPDKCATGWSGEDCATKACLPGCELHGKCVHETGKCECTEGWTGENCFVETCANNCSGVGKCQLLSAGKWNCACDGDHFGESCEFARERDCEDGVDNDSDGLTDCEDSVECCGQSACSSSPMCLMSEASLAWQFGSERLRSSPDTTFFDRVKFIFDGEQRYADQKLLEPNRVSVMRGRVYSSVGGPLSGVRVSDAQHPQQGFSITHTKGHDSTDEFGTVGTFDLVVNGGGFVTLQFVRQPFGRILRAFYVPWNRLVHIGDIEIGEEVGTLLLQNATARDDKCRNHRLNPETISKSDVVSSWTTRQFAGMTSDQRTFQKRSTTVFADSGVVVHRVPITNGIEFVYSSARSDAFRSRLHMRMLGATVPSELRRVHLAIHVAGRRFRKIFAPVPKLAWTFIWDGVNAFGQMEHGLVDVDVAIGYEYEHCPLEHQILWHRKHALLGGAPIGSNALGTDSAGPWTLNIQHRLDPINGVLERGDGSVRYLDKSAESVLVTVLGHGATPMTKRPVSCADAKDNCKRREPAESALLSSPTALAMAPDGRLFIGDHNWIRRLSADGTSLETLLELDALDTGHQYHLAFDTTSNALLISLPLRRQVWRLLETDKSPANIANNYVILAGTGESCVESAQTNNNAGMVESCGDGGPAEQAQLSFPKGLAFDTDSNLYIADGRKLRMLVKKSQTIHTLISDNKPWRPLATCAHVFPLEELNLEWPSALTLDAQTGQLFILDSSQFIYRVDFGARVAHMVAGKRQRDCDQELRQVNALNNVQAIAFDSERGILYLSESDGRRVNFVKAIDAARSIEPDPVRVVAGRLGKCDCHPVTCPCDTSPMDPTPPIATHALLHKPTGLAVHPERGVLYIADQGNAKLKRLERVRLRLDPESRTFQLNSPGTDEAFSFDSRGRHLWTASIVGARPIYNFSYFSSEKGAGISRVQINGDPDQSVQINRVNESWVEIVTGERGKALLELNTFDRSLVDSILHSSNGQLSLTSFEYGPNQLLTTSIANPGSRPTFIAYDAEIAWPRNITLASGDQFQIDVPEFVGDDGLLTEVRFNGRSYRKYFSRVETGADGEKRTVFKVDGTKAFYSLISNPSGYELESLGGAQSVQFTRLANHPLLQPHESVVLRQKVSLSRIGNDASQRQHTAKLEWRNYVRRAIVSGDNDDDDNSGDEQGPRRTVQINGRTVFSLDYDRVHRRETLVDSYENELIRLGYDHQGHVTSILAMPNGRHASSLAKTHGSERSKTIVLGWDGELQRHIEFDHQRPTAEFLTTHMEGQWLRHNISYSENPTGLVTVEMSGGEQFVWTAQIDQGHGDESASGIGTVQQQLVTPSGERHLFQKIPNFAEDGTSTVVRKIFGESVKSGEEGPSVAFAGSIDANGRLKVAQAGRGETRQRVEFVRNEFDQLVTIRHSNETFSLAFAYDEFGRLINVSSPLMDRSLSYEGAFLRSSKTRTFSDRAFASTSAHFSYEYTGGDQLFRLSALNAVFNNRIAVEPLRFHYAGNGGGTLGVLPSRASDTVFEYSAQKTSIIHSAFQLERDWTSTNRLETLRLAFAGDPVLNVRFTYDPIGRLSSAKWTLVRDSAERVEHLEYHQNGHIAQVNSSAGQWNLGRDQNLRLRQINGVRVRLGPGGVPLRFGDLRYETAPGTGWTLRRGNTAFVYDAFGQIVHCTLQTVGEEASREYAYVYDDLNRVIRRTERVAGDVGQRVQTFHYALPHGPHLITHFTDSNTNDLIWTIGYTADNDEAFLLENSAGQRYALVVDHEKSVRFAVDITGAIARELAYSPTGAAVVDTNPGGLFLPIGYRSQFHDHSADLVIFYESQQPLARPFDPLIGRFMSTDLFEMAKWPETIRRPELVADPLGHHQDFQLDGIEQHISAWLRRRGFSDLSSLVFGPPQFTQRVSSSASPFAVSFLNSDCDNSIVSIGAVCAAREELRTFHQLLTTPTPNIYWWSEEMKSSSSRAKLPKMSPLGFVVGIHEGEVNQLHFSAGFDQTSRIILEQIFVGARVEATPVNIEDLLTESMPLSTEAMPLSALTLSKRVDLFDGDQQLLTKLAKNPDDRVPWPMVSASKDDSERSIRIEFPWKSTGQSVYIINYKN